MVQQVLSCYIQLGERLLCKSLLINVHLGTLVTNAYFFIFYKLIELVFYILYTVESQYKEFQGPDKIVPCIYIPGVHTNQINEYD